MDRKKAFRCGGANNGLGKRLLKIWKLKDVVCMVCTKKKDLDCLLRIGLLRRSLESREESLDGE